MGLFRSDADLELPMNAVRHGFFALLLWLASGWVSVASAQAPAQAPAAQASEAPSEFSRLLLKEQADKINSAIAQRRVEQAWREAALAQAVREDNHFTLTLYKQAVVDVILTILVIVIVSIGLWMSYLQIKTDVSPTSLKVSKDGLEMSSSVIGLFVLLASMFFFYVYIDKVYEIRRVGASDARAGAPVAKSKP